MARSFPTYLAIQATAQAASTVPFGLWTLINGAITTATTAGQFSTMVDCSLFADEDIFNVRIYLSSLEYLVGFTKNDDKKTILIDWSKPAANLVTNSIGTVINPAEDYAQGIATFGQNGVLNQAAVTTAAPTYTTGQTSPMSLTTSGGLRVDGSGVTQPVSGIVTANEGSALDVENNIGFSVVSEALPTAAMETAVFLIKNPNGSGKKLKLNVINLGLSPSVGSATGNNGVFRLYLDPTVTVNGTALTISNLYSQTSPPVTVMAAFSSPTVTANGVKLAVYDIASNHGSMLVPQGGTRVLDPSHSWLITQTGIVNGAATGLIELEWVEK